jgi:predicted ATP-binding protein involved in virulence
MRVLHRLLTNTKSVALLATHSPFVVREVQNSQVHVLRSTENGGSSVSKPLLQTLGANVATVSSEVFGDDTPAHLYQELVSKAETDGLTFQQALERYADELSTEALMLLRSRMENPS